MKLVFERETYAEIIDDLRMVLAGHPAAPKIISPSMSEETKSSAQPVANIGDNSQGSEGSGPEALPEGASDQPPAKKPIGRPPGKKAAPPPKAAAKAAKPKPAPVDADDAVDADAADANPFENGAAKKALSPAEIAKIKAQTIEELQAAYSGGKQKQVFALLAKYGDGAKSFRELSTDAFLPIREAIDAGGLA